MNFYSILDHGKSLLKHEMMLIIPKMLNLKCLFHGKDMKVYKLLFCSSTKSISFCYNKVFPICFQKGFARMILKIVLVNKMLLVVDLVMQQYMILNIMATKLRVNFRSDPLKGIYKVFQEN